MSESAEQHRTFVKNTTVDQSMNGQLSIFQWIFCPLGEVHHLGINDASL
jgi:hypothetical protein